MSPNRSNEFLIRAAKTSQWAFVVAGSVQSKIPKIGRKLPSVMTLAGLADVG
jgi:hypothetical protein